MTEKLSEWKKKRFTMPLFGGDGRPRDLMEVQDEHSESEHHREAEIARAASARTSAEVKALERENAALAKKVSRLEAAETPLPEWSAPVDTDGGNVGGNVKRTREPPARKGQEGDSQPSYRVRVRGDTVGKGD